MSSPEASYRSPLETAALTSMSLVSAARAHNSAQPVSKLPVEILQRIFNHASSWLDRRSIAPNFPGATAVCSYWRAAALGYALLWRYICIAPRSLMSMGSHPGCIVLPPSPADLHRLEEHAQRAHHRMHARIVCHDHETSQTRGLEDFVPRLYALSSFFRRLDIEVCRDLPLAIPSLFPLPRALAKLENLIVTVGEWEDPPSDHDVAMRIFQDGTRIYPIDLLLDVPGGIIDTLPLIDPSRLKELSIVYSDALELSRILQLLGHAPKLRGLKLVANCRTLLGPLGADFTKRPVQQKLPSLERLSIDFNWASIRNAIDPDCVDHLRITGDHWADLSDNLTTTLQSFSALKTLCITDRSTLPWERQYWHYEHGACRHLLQSWLSGKTSLVMLAVPRHALVHPCAHAFAPSCLPALRYLIILDDREQYVDGLRPEIESHWTLAENQVQAVRHKNSQVSVTWHRSPVRAEGHWSRPGYRAPRENIPWENRVPLCMLYEQHKAGDTLSLGDYGLLAESREERTHGESKIEGDTPKCFMDA